MIEEVPEAIQEEVFTEKAQNKNGERQNNSRSPPPRYSMCNAAPTFAVTVIDADLDVCPIDIEGRFCRAMFCLLAVLIYLYVSLTTGMEFGPTSDQIMRQRQSISTCDSAMSQASKLCI